MPKAVALKDPPYHHDTAQVN
eukprot:SAG22_NODE_20945_length_261_cov_0.882716_1_plen_20_part_01